MLFKADNNWYECTDTEMIHELLNDEEYNIIQVTDTISVILGTGWWYQHYCMTDSFGGTVQKIF